MKRYLLLFLISAFCFARHQAVGATNLLSIYLIAGDEYRFPLWHPSHRPKPETLKLLLPPVLADADFVGFDITNQTFIITAGAAMRLEARIRNGPPTLLNHDYYELIPYPTPFVLKAADEPIYMGAFYTSFSSSFFEGPVILSDTMFIKSDLTNNVKFRIELGYPGTSPGMADPRRDRRIVLAVKKLFSDEKK